MDLRIIFVLLVCIFAVSSHRHHGGGYGRQYRGFGSRRHGNVSRRRCGFTSRRRYGIFRRRTHQSRRRYRVPISSSSTTTATQTTKSTTTATVTRPTTPTTTTTTVSTTATRSTPTTEPTPPMTKDSDSVRIADFLNGHKEANDHENVDEDVVRRVMDLLREEQDNDQFADLIDDYDEVPEEDGESSDDTASAVKEVKDNHFANELEEMLDNQ